MDVRYSCGMDCESRRDRSDFMSKSKVVTVQLDTELKQDVEHIFSELGLSTSQAIALFYKHVQLSRGLPFEGRIPNAETREALADAETRNNLTNYDSVEDLFVDLGI